MDKSITFKNENARVPLKIAKPKEKPLIEPKPETKEVKPIEIPKKEIRMSIDGLRGLKLLTTGIGDKKSNKDQLGRELNHRLVISRLVSSDRS
ncbi:MAG: hypothetical protein HWN65_08425 [Candidatus Helarchaeota archaeon]|nr:hypothetical protein [Candidatus Helarchaeota archaeon]